MLRAGTVWPLFRRPVDADEHRLDTGDLTGREDDLGDGAREVTAGELEEVVAHVDLGDSIIEAHRVEFQGCWNRGAITLVDLARIRTADQFVQQRHRVTISVALHRAQRRLLGAVGPEQVDAIGATGGPAAGNRRRAGGFAKVIGNVPGR